MHFENCLYVPTLLDSVFLEVFWWRAGGEGFWLTVGFWC